MHQGTVHRAGIEGVWVLDQIDTYAALTQTVKDSINHALAYNNVAGFVPRIPWAELESTRGTLNTQLLQACKDIATTAGVEMSLRWMAGRRCPPWLFTTDGCRYYLNGNTHGAETTACSVTSGSRVMTITAASPNASGKPRTGFIAGDAGKEIVVYGAGAGGSDLYTTIQTYTSLTQVVLASAPVTVTGKKASWGGSRVPHPCDVNGNPNPIYINRMNIMYEMLADWCDAHSVRRVSPSHYSNDWAEIYGSLANHLLPVAGYDTTGDKWRAAHRALLDSFKVLSDGHPNITQELPTSGIQPAPLQYSGGTNPVPAYAITLWGPNSPYWYFLNTGVGQFGAGNPGGASTYSRAGQMYDTLTHPTGYWDLGGTAAAGGTNIYEDWLVAGDLCYQEIYREQFAGTQTELQSMINRWVPLLVDPTPPPPPNGWGVNAWGSSPWGGGTGPGIKFISVPRLSIPLTFYSPRTRYRITHARLALAITFFAPKVVTTGPQTVVAPRLAIGLAFFQPKLVIDTASIVDVPRLEIPITGFTPAVGQRVAADRLTVPLTFFGPTIIQPSLPRSSAKVADHALHTCVSDDEALNTASVIDRALQDAGI